MVGESAHSFALCRVFRFSQARAFDISASVLAAVAVFGIAFGWDEAVVVVYLRAALGISTDSFSNLPSMYASIETFREAATMVMLLAVAFVSAKVFRERVAVFLWAFAFWDLSYYAGLWATIKWPSSLLTPDVLFLIPVPWLAQVWFPIVVSGLTIVAVVLVNRKR